MPRGGRNRAPAGRIRRCGKGGATMATTNSRAATRSTTGELRPPLPPYDRDGAARKVRLAEDAWNSRDPAKVATGYTVDSVWRHRAEFLSRRGAIVQFLTPKWTR